MKPIGKSKTIEDKCCRLYPIQLVTYLREVLLRLVFFISISLLTTDFANAGDSDPVLESIKQSWTTRTNSVLNIQCVYREELTQIDYPPWGKAVTDSALPRVRRTVEHEIRIDGGKVLLATNQLAQKLSKHEVRFSKRTFDGIFSRTYIVNGDGESSATIKSGANDISNHLTDLPVFLAYRPLLPQFSKFLVDSKVRQGNYNGMECVILTRNDSRQSQELWVAKTLDFLPVRYLSYVDKKKSIVLEVSYEDKAGVPVLKEWNYDVWSHDGVLDISSRCIVGTIDTKADISSDLFVLKFPVDVKVIDLDIKTNSRKE